MSKVMIVEDDESLREIYSIRLTAEGYAVVSAHDGEEALAVAVRERPDLIVSDVMMPKISGFDMLDILRSTPETRNIKVIMMTALSSDDQRERGENLGADRYLVKSQVGIEDVVNVVHEVLGDRNNSGMITPGVTNPQPQATTQTSIPNPASPQAATPSSFPPRAQVTPPAPNIFPPQASATPSTVSTQAPVAPPMANPAQAQQTDFPPFMPSV